MTTSARISSFAPQRKTLSALLKSAATTDAGITSYASAQVDFPGNRMTYAELLSKAGARAQLIHQIEGISAASVILLHFDSHSENLEWFWAVIIAGYLPAISAPFVHDIEQRKKHLNHLHDLLQDPIVLTSQKLIPEFLGIDLLKIRAVENIESRTSSYKIEEIRRHDIAVLMLTSGSTGRAKAVCLGPDQIRTSVESKSQFHNTTKNDVFLNWIGLDHVAGLLQIHLHAMFLGAEQIHVPAGVVIAEPARFLRLIDGHRITYTFAPHFFLALLSRNLADYPLEPSEINISCLKAIESGGEAVSVKTCAVLHQQLHRYHLKEDVIQPAFGMTETCAGITYRRSSLSYDFSRGLEFASLGSVFANMKIRILTDKGVEAAQGEIGNLQLSGPILFQKYYNNRLATKRSLKMAGSLLVTTHLSIWKEISFLLAETKKPLL